VAFDDDSGYRKAQSRSRALPGLQTLERLENPLEIGGIDTVAVIPNCKEPFPILLTRVDVNARGTPSAVPQSILQQILENLDQTVGITGDGR
jgi:hypothetical protein